MVECLQTWRNPATQISAASEKSLSTQEDKVVSHNIAHAHKFKPGGPLSKISLASCKRRGVGKFSEYLAELRGIVKTTSWSIKKLAEGPFSSANHDASGLLLKSHLRGAGEMGLSTCLSQYINR